MAPKAVSVFTVDRTTDGFVLHCDCNVKGPTRHCPFTTGRFLTRVQVWRESATELAEKIKHQIVKCFVC